MPPTGPTSAVLQDYVAFCPSCGQRLTFGQPLVAGQTEAVTGRCPCGRCWSFVFDVDGSGTFGVVGLQCDNGDRVMKGATE